MAIPRVNAASRRLRAFLGLRLQVLLLLVLSFGAMFLLSAYLAHRWREDAIEHATERVRAASEAIASEQRSAIADAKRLIEGLVAGGDPTVLAAAPDCREKLAGLVSREPRWTSISLVGPAGDFLCSSVATSTPINVGDREYFSAGMAAPGVVVGEAVYGRASGKFTLPLFGALRDKAGIARGGVLVALDLAWIGGHLAPGFDAGARLGIMDANALVLARVPDPEGIVGKRAPDAEVYKIARALGGQGVTESVGLDGVPRIYSFVPFAQTAAGPLTLHVGVSRHSVVGPIDRQFYSTLLVLTAIAVALCGAAWIGGERVLLRPLTRISAFAQRIGTGDPQARTGLAHGHDEIGRLARVLDDMAESLASTSRLVHANRALRMLSALNQTLVHAKSEQALLNDMCRAIVEAGALAAASVSYGAPGAGKPLERVAQWGTVPAPPSSVLELPLESDGEQIGVLAIHAAEPGAFNEGEIGLLREGAADIGFGLATLRTRTELRSIEWMLSRRAERAVAPAPQPYGDLTALNTARTILDAVGGDLLHDIVSDYMDLLETSSAVYEKNGDYAYGIFASGWCQAMDYASYRGCGLASAREALACGRWHCHESCWNEASRKSIEIRDATDIACAGGIRLHAVPIFAGDEIVGSINFGYASPPQDEARLAELSAKYGVAVDELRRSAAAYRERPPFIIELAKRRLQGSARLIGEIVQRRRAQEALRTASQYTRSLIEASPDPLVTISAAGKVTDVNEGSIKVTGVPREALIGSDFSDYFTEPDRAREGYRQAFARGSVTDYPLTIRHKDGHLTDVLYNASVYKDAGGSVLGVLAAARDVTAAKRATEALRASEHRLSESQRIAHLGSWDLDLGTDQVRWSDEVFRIYGLPRRDGAFPNAQARAMNPAEDQPRVDEAFRAALAGEKPLEVEHRIRRPDGAIRWVKCVAELIRDDAGRPKRALGTVLDITDLKHAQQAIAELNRQLEQRVAQRTAALTAANKELEAFAYSVSHDLRGPLRAIDGFSRILEEDYGRKVDEDGKDALHRVRLAAQRMGGLIDDLLKLSRLSRAEMSFEGVDLSAMAATIAEELRAGDPGRRMNFQIAPGLSAHGDKRLLGVLMENLLANAWKFTSKHASARIELGTAAIDGERAFFVRDDGAGFDMAHADKLFTPFQRLHGMAEFPGSGIGLATVRRIVQRHGGRAWAEGAVEKGATVYFTLGAAPAAAPAKAREAVHA